MFARHTALELPEQAKRHIVLVAVRETETQPVQDIPSAEFVGIGVAVAETEVAVAVDIPSVEVSGIAVGSLVGPGAVVVPSNCCTFWVDSTRATRATVEGCGVMRGIGSGQDDTPLLSKLQGKLHIIAYVRSPSSTWTFQLLAPWQPLEL